LQDGSFIKYNYEEALKKLEDLAKEV